MEFTPIFVTGTFRSATTLMAKALSANDKIFIADDPFFQFFKEFRNEFFYSNGLKNFDNNYPISDNFYSNHIELNRKIKNSNLSLPFKSRTLESFSLGCISL